MHSFNKLIKNIVPAATLAGVLFFTGNENPALALDAGDLDPTFGTGGKVLATVPDTEAAYGVAIAADGKIVIATGTVGPDNSGDFVVLRLNANGSPDLDFGTGGRVLISFDSFAQERAAAIAIQSDGKIVIAGWVYLGSDFGLARLNPNGTLDDTFGTGGKLKVPSDGENYPAGMVLQSDGKIVVVGKSRPTPNYEAMIVRVNTNGTLDTTFNGTGILVLPLAPGAANDFASAVVVQPDGKIVMAGCDGADFAVVRLNANGSLDTSFDGNGIATTPVGTQGDAAYAVTLQPDGKIIAAGSSHSGSGNQAAIVRYNANGSLDTTFDGDGKVIFTSATVEAGVFKSVISQADGKVLAAGTGGDATFSGQFILARYDANGAPDTGFGTDGVVKTTFSNNNDSSLYAAIAQSDGKVVAVGSGRSNGNFSFAAARYLMTATAPATAFDFDADGRADISVFRPASGAWYLNQSQAGFFGRQFGSGTDRIAPADYDGDGKTDIAVYRPSEGQWYIVNSSNGVVEYHVFGLAEDLPAPADYDGDNKADICVFRPSTGTWWRRNSSNGTFSGIQFGLDGDQPTVGDFDGDGKSDIGIWRASNGDWYHINSSDGSIFGERFGISTDKMVPADYDGDGKTDIAVWRPSSGIWYIKQSSDSAYASYLFGLPTDIPAPGDFDGDGKADRAVFRESDGTWYITNSTNGTFTIFPWGQTGDVPTPSAFGN